MPANRPRLGKNVFILGAGASAHAGIPLMSDFLHRARSLMLAQSHPSTKRELRYPDRLTEALEWIDGLRAAAYYAEVNVDNLEHVFSMAQLCKEAGEERGSRAYDALRYLIMETIDSSAALTMRDGQYLTPDSVYARFFETIREVCGADTGLRDLEHDAIITLNYDVLLDNAMQFQFHVTPDYGLSGEPGETSWPLYKLHGSLNWAVHDGCEKPNAHEVQVLDPTPLPKGHHPRPGSQRFAFRMVTFVMHEHQCKFCGRNHVLAPIIVPPTWSKSPSAYKIGPVWQKAMEALRGATQLMIIGYSLPPTDTFFPYLVALGLQGNSRLRKVLVVNTERSGATEERYKRVFSRSLPERGGFEYIQQEFKDFVFDSSFEERLRCADLR